VDMDETDELVALLCTHIGMIMEDASVVALTIGSLSPTEKLAATARLQQWITIMARLIEAVSAVTP
jgi:hypothetical protein